MADWLLAAAAAVATMLVNISFGFWRGHASRLGRRLEWVLAIHAPVPLIVLLRSLAGVGLSVADAPFFALFVAAYFSGQRIGGMLYSRVSAAGVADTRCFLRGLYCLLGARRC